jgi:hypothetical protein
VSLLPFFEFCEHSAIGETIRTSLWLFPVIECFHLLGLVVIGGSVLVVDMRLLGLGLRSQPVAQLAKDAQRWLVGSLVVMLASGVLLFTSEATKCYYHAAFWVKMTSLLLAILFTFTVRRKVTAADKPSPLLSKLVAMASVTLWSAVGIGGRWIGFS